MAMSSDEELRLRCLELAAQGNPKSIVARARTYYRFAKGDRPVEDTKVKKLPEYSQAGEARRVAPMIRPT
jgi:hypothetical protein